MTVHMWNDERVDLFCEGDAGDAGDGPIDFVTRERVEDVDCVACLRAAVDFGERCAAQLFPARAWAARLAAPFVREAFEPRNLRTLSPRWPSIFDVRGAEDERGHGWCRLGEVDDVGRRAFWFRLVWDGEPDQLRLREIRAVEIRAGREGDDCAAVIHRSAPMFQQIVDALLHGFGHVKRQPARSEKP